MIEVQNAEQDNMLEIKALEKLSEQDLDMLVPVLEDHVNTHNPSCLLVIIENFKGWSDSAAFWKDIKLDTKFAGKFNQIAVAGDREWEKWLIRIFGPAASSEIKYFPLTDLSEARNWLINY